ncbi:glycosyltransferase family 9 protein [candidate division KSB1 bacterium]|nr:glycosyltransferase family 9 protein [candidate division KSB1 bacterium]
MQTNSMRRAGNPSRFPRRPLLIKWFRACIKWIFRRLLKVLAFFLLKNGTIDPNRINRILIMAYIGVGDMIMFTPALKRLRQKYPRAHITLQIGLRNSCEQVIQNSNLIDAVREIPLEKKFFKFIIYGWKQRHQYDLLITDFHHAFYELAFETLMLDVPWRIGHTHSPGFPHPFDFLFNYRISMLEAQHTIERDLWLLKPLAIETNFGNEKENTEIYLSAAARDFAENYWEQQGLKAVRVIGIQAGTAPLGRWKQWPLAKFRDLITTLLARDFTVILFGAPNERAMLETLCTESQPRLLLFAGQGSLLQTSALIEKCQYMITNDSGLMHVANALKVPLTAIYGPTDYRRTQPLGKNSHLLRVPLPCSPCFKLEGDTQVLNCPIDYQCFREISVEMVIQNVCQYFPENHP